jgi:hypothetical protein
MISTYRFRRRDLDEFGILTADSLRQLAHHLWDCPPDLRILIDLGPCRQLQQQLIRELSLYACASSIRFAGHDWRAVRTHTQALAKAIGSPAAEVG